MTSQIPQEGYIRLNQLIGTKESMCPIIPVSSATIWNWVRSGKFPKPVRLSESITAWHVDDIRKFIAERGEL